MNCLYFFGVSGVLGGQQLHKLRTELSLESMEILTFFHADFGKEFPSRTFWTDLSRDCPSPSSALCPLLYRTEHFSRGENGENVPRKGEEEGWPAKGAKRKKGRVKTGQFPHVDLLKQSFHCSSLLPFDGESAECSNPPLPFVGEYAPHART